MPRRGRDDHDKPARVDVDALLAGVDIVDVIGKHVPLKKSGAEFEACCPFHTEDSPSFKVSHSKQFYHCFGCGANGDAIKFLQEHLGLTFKQAVEELGAGGQRAAAPAAARAEREEASPASRSPWVPVMPVPEDCAEPPRAHLARRFPTAVWTYRDAAGRVLGHVYRFTSSDGGKEVLPLTWCKHAVSGKSEWRWVSFPVPRPLFGLDRLAERPDDTVLLVEGEKCAEAAAEHLPAMVAVSWPGGGGAVDKVDWSPLAGRKVVLWADCDAKREPVSRAERAAGTAEEAAALQAQKPLLAEDKQPGVKAMAVASSALLALGCRLWRVRIPAPGEKLDGWDVADAVAEGLVGDDLVAWVRARTERVVDRSAAAGSAGGDGGPPGGGGDDEPPVFLDDCPDAWRSRLLRKDGRLIDCRENVYLLLKHHPDWDGVLWADEFARKIVKRAPPPWEPRRGFVAAPWGEDDDLRLGMWLAQTHKLLVRGVETLAAAVGWVARESCFHPVRDYLDGLVWDGSNRCDHWVADYLGVRRSDYAAVSGRYALIGMVSRIYRPGGILRSMPILEGKQFRGKSTALKILGGPWFSDTALDLNHKDAYQAIQGVWVYEISEMDAFNRSESARMKGFISSPSDRFRAPYGREPVDWPRQTAFFGTINPHGEYFKDPTGNTRYWPWACEQEDAINLDALADQRDQLFAEAVVRYKRGERWHPTADEQRTLFDGEQEYRTIEDSWDVLIDRYLRTITANRVTVTDILLDCMKLERGKITKQHSTTVGQAMARTGWLKDRDGSGARERFYWRPKGWGEERKEGGKGG